MKEGLKLLALGAGDGWHTNELRQATQSRGGQLVVASYESLSSSIAPSRDSRNTIAHCATSSDGVNHPIESFDAVIARTMPAGSLEKITFRLAVLHAIAGDTVVNPHPIPVINTPSGLEIAIDKFATLSMIARMERVRELGFTVPATCVVQSRGEAMNAFRSLGGDCVIKPLFGGEGRGVMRVFDEQLAWYAFAALDQLDSVFYVQQFVPPGGCDARLFVIGENVIACRRKNPHDFRTNVSSGASIECDQPTEEQLELAHLVADSISLTYTAIDLIDCDDGTQRILEVNAVPGWKGIQGVTDFSIADALLSAITVKLQNRRVEIA